MPLAELFCKGVRYRTLRAFLFTLLVFVLVANITLLISTKYSLQLSNTNSRYPFLTRLFVNPPGVRATALGNSPRTKFNVEEIQKAGSRDRSLETTQGSVSDCSTWCQSGDALSPPYNLSAVLLVRIYRQDLAGLTSREMLQWLYYLRYAGFDHVFVYDAYVTKNESQHDVLRPLIQSGYVTYVDWSAHNPYTIDDTQIASYRDCVAKYGKNVKWQIAIDIDEYPFSVIDQKQNFMLRFLEKYTKDHPDVSQITLENYLFLGKPLDDQTNPLLIDRIRRRTLKPANKLGKSVYKVSNILKAHVHHNDMRAGKSVDCDWRLMRMNHYWGARLQNWGEDTPKVLDITERDYSIQPIVEEMNRCSKCFGEENLYVRRWN